MICSLLCAFAAANAFAQTETIILARMGMRDAATYHYLEAMQSRGRWIVPDVSYIDFGSNKYREFSIGGGADLYASQRLTVTGEAYFTQATGPAAHSARYLVPWTEIVFNPTSRIHSETVYFPYFPLNHPGRIQHVLERSKVEYVFSRFKLGAGYAAYQYGDNAWENKPFVTTTLRAGALGDLELWLQRLPRNRMQAQIRYRFKTTRPKHD